MPVKLPASVNVAQALRHGMLPTAQGRSYSCPLNQLLCASLAAAK